MRKKYIFVMIFALVLALGFTPGSVLSQRLELKQGFAAQDPLAPLGTSFTYQGRLTVGGSPAEGVYDFEFKLFDALIGGGNVGSTVTLSDVSVRQGIFSVALDFGDVFDGTALFLEISVRAGGSSSAYTPLAPRQALMAAPFARYAQNAVQLDGKPGVSYQARVSGNCAVGSSIRAVNADGTVECQPPPQLFTRTTLDYQGSVGTFSSITLGTDGLGLISYYDITNKDLRVAHCNDAACSSASITTLDATGDVGKYTSITIGGDGMGLISYRDETNKDLKVAHCNDVACSSASTNTLEVAGDSGYDTAITTGGDGLGLIAYSYYNGNLYLLKVTHCIDPACSSATITTKDSSANSWYNSITTDPNGLGYISYHDIGNENLKVIHCGDADCSNTSGGKNTVDTSGNVGQFSSITFGADGLRLISYYDADQSALKVIHCNNPNCSSADKYILDQAGIVGKVTSISIGVDGLALISYYDETNQALKIAHCDDTACSNASTHIVDNSASIGLSNNIVIGADGLGLISYYDSTNGDLVVAHCDDLLCKP